MSKSELCVSTVPACLVQMTLVTSDERIYCVKADTIKRIDQNRQITNGYDASAGESVSSMFSAAGARRVESGWQGLAYLWSAFWICAARQNRCYTFRHW